MDRSVMGKSKYRTMKQREKRRKGNKHEKEGVNTERRMEEKNM